MSAPAQTHCSARLRIQGEMLPEYAQILTPDAVALVSELVERFAPQRGELLKQRVARQARIDGGELPDFLPETKAIREGDWKIAPLPKALERRRTEITGPVEAKMIINAFNSGADSYMTDFEDSNSPNWENQIQGQIKGDGTVMLINRNGIVFSGSSQVNVRNLVAAATGFSDEQFTAKGLYSSSNSAPGFTQAAGKVTVERGAQIQTQVPATSTAGGGYVLLLGKEVENAGTISTARGQTTLAAGDSLKDPAAYVRRLNKLLVELSA